jgi:hypothetical protein
MKYHVQLAVYKLSAYRVHAAQVWLLVKEDGAVISEPCRYDAALYCTSLSKHHCRALFLDRPSYTTCLYDAPEGAIISPFDETKTVSPAADTDKPADDEELPLTRENVELVLDEMRPYLKADG